MRILFNAGLAIVLSAAMVGMPVMAAPANMASAPFGVVLQAERASIGTGLTLGGATIYDGDRLSTAGEGALRVRFGGAQMYLRPSTIATVHNLPNGFSADLGAGTVVLSSAEGQTFQLLADGATIRPASGQTTTAQVTWVSPTQLLLTASRGPVQITIDNDVKTIEAGSSYRVEVEADDAGPQGSGGPLATGRSHRLIIILVGAGVAAGTVFGIWKALVSPSNP